MKISRRFVSVLIALAMIVSTVSLVASFSASAEDEAAAEKIYFQKFTEDNFVDYGLYTKTGTWEWEANGVAVDTKVPAASMTYNEDSFRMESLVEQEVENSQGETETVYGVLGTSAIFSLDDTARDPEVWEIAKENGQKVYDETIATKETEAEKEAYAKSSPAAPTVYASVYVENAEKYNLDRKGEVDTTVMVDTQVVFSLQMKDGSFRRVSTTYMDMYQTKLDIAIPMRYTETVLDADGNPVLDDSGKAVTQPVVLENLDDVTGIKVEMYHWERKAQTIVVSNLTVSGSAELPELPPIEVEPGTQTATFFNFNSIYKKDYGGNPDKVNYSADGEKYTPKAVGWANLRATLNNPLNQWQVYYQFDRDAANYALTVANMEGNSKTMEVTVDLISCVDQEDQPVVAEIEFMFETYEKIDGQTMQIFANAWQQPGTSATYKFDVSQYDINMIKGVRFAIQNYAYYNEDGVICEWADTDGDGKQDSYVDLDGNVVGNKEDGKEYKGIAINMEANISPITVSVDTTPPTTRTVTTTTTTTKDPNAEVEGAGYHFLEMTSTNFDDTFGNAPETIVITEKGAITTVNLKDQAIASKSSVEDDTYTSTYLGDDEDYLGPIIKLKSPTKVSQQHQMGWYVSSEYMAERETGYDGPEFDYSDQVRQCVEYAQNAAGLLAVDVTVNSCKHGATKEDCGAQIEVMIHTFDAAFSVDVMKWVSVGQTGTLFLDVSELNPDDVQMLRYVAQNYANVNPDTGNACGCTDVDVDFSPLYVPGNDQMAQTTQKVTVPADEDEAKYIADLYNALPGTNASDYTTYDQFLALEKFVQAYADASVATQKVLEEKYGITMDDYGVLMELYNTIDVTQLVGFPGFGADGSPSTGAVAAPIGIALAACAAGYAVYKTRKKN